MNMLIDKAQATSMRHLPDRRRRYCCSRYNMHCDTVTRYMTPFDLVDFDGHEAVHFFSDASTGLEAIIAIHSTALGPAAGGCRRWAYPSRDAALIDALRLARGMSYKNAMAGLPFGGGKAVVLKHHEVPSHSLFMSLGRAIDSLGGSYVTAEDVGTNVADMQAVARSTRFVSGLSGSEQVAGGNPSPKTAHGVFCQSSGGLAISHRHRSSGCSGGGTGFRWSGI